VFAFAIDLYTGGLCGDVIVNSFNPFSMDQEILRFYFAFIYQLYVLKKVFLHILNI
jgi:hypothetical protein